MESESEYYYQVPNVHPFTRKQPVWNPLVSLGEMEKELFISVEKISSYETEVVQVLSDLKVPVSNVEPQLVQGMEVGDDRVDLSFSTITLGRELVYQEKILGMKTSWKDTFISKESWNFCEVTSSIPDSPLNSISVRFMAGGLQKLGFCDAPVLRLVSNVQKADRSHSSSATGKCAMVGRRLLTPNEQMRPRLQLASYIQDGCLNTIKNDEPKYLHGIVGGGGCPPLWDNPRNTYLYLLSYKAGSYARVYASAINEARNCVDQMDQGIPAAPVLCQRLREKQEYLHATYAQSVLVPPKPVLKGAFGDDPVPLYKASGSVAYLQGAERRLLATRKVITRLEAEIESQRSLRIKQFLFGVETGPRQEELNRFENRRAAEEYGHAFRANAAVKALLDREASGHEVSILISEFGFKDPGIGRATLNLSDVVWLCEGGKGQAYTIDDLLPSYDMYLRDEVSLEETMRVPGIPLTPMIGGNFSTKDTVAKIGIWDSNPSLDAWADRFIGRMNVSRNNGIIPGASEVLDFLKGDREWVSDDPILLGLVRRDTEDQPAQTVLIVTTDRKLCKTICESTGNYVAVVHPDVLIKLSEKQVFTAGDNLDEELARIKDRIDLRGARPPIIHGYVDYGSLKAVAIGGYPRIEQDDFFRGRRVKRTQWETGRFPEGRELREQFIFVPEVLDFKVLLMSPNGQSLTLVCTTSDSEPSVPSRRNTRLSRFAYKSAERFSSSIAGMAFRRRGDKG